MKHQNISVFIPHVGCPHRCSFCDQKAISGHQEAPTPQEVEALLSWAVGRALENGPGQAARTEIAFFGGSFTALPRDYMRSLLAIAQKYVASAGLGGIRISTRPDCVDEATLALLKGYGVTAVELGAQSMRDTVLRQNSRGHTARDVSLAAGHVRGAGLSLGLQMMTGLWGDDAAGALSTARLFAEMRPDTVRIYPTVVLEGTPLADAVRASLYHPPGVEETVPLCCTLLEYFMRAGIPVVRLGLHAAGDVEKKLVAGAYHPALRELCEGELLFCRARALLAGRAPGPYSLLVRPADISRMVGQKKRNLLRFQQLGYAILVVPSPGLAPFEVRLGRGAPPGKEGHPCQKQ